jgi:hypothetical protein
MPATCEEKDMHVSIRWKAAAVAAACVTAAGGVVAASPATAAPVDLSLRYVSGPTTITTAESATYTVEVVNEDGYYGAGANIYIEVGGPVASITPGTACVLDDVTTVRCGSEFGGPDMPKTFTYTVTPSGSGTLTSTAEVKVRVTGDTDPNPSNNTDQRSTTVTAPPSADLGVSLSASAGVLSSQIAYVLGVSNAGPGGATASTVDVSLPAGVTSVTGLPSTCSYAGSTVTCDTGAIANGASKSVPFTASFGLLALGPLNATASRTSSSPNDPNAANDSASANCTAVTGLVIVC